jgi:hypothetical protein
MVIFLGQQHTTEKFIALQQIFGNCDYYYE